MEARELIQKIPKPKLRGDKVLWICVLFFAMVSVLAVFSSSSFIANRHDMPKTAIFFSQLKFVAMGFFTLFVFYLIPMRLYRRAAFAVFLITLAGLLAAMLFGEEINGAKRSLDRKSVV